MQINYNVLKVTPLNNYKLRLVFADGRVKDFDCAPLLTEKLYSPLENPVLFMKAHTLCGGVAWNDEIDICPEYLYEKGVNVS